MTVYLPYNPRCPHCHGPMPVRAVLMRIRMRGGMGLRPFDFCSMRCANDFADNWSA